jgi:hypothetical protein
MTEDRRHRSPRPKGRSSPTRPRGPADRPRSHPPSKQLPEPAPDTAHDSPLWWARIRSSYTPGRRGALPQAPDTDDDYDYTKYDFPLWWASIRLSDLLKIAQANGSKMWTMRLALAEGHWQAFLRERAAVRTRLQRTDWSRVPATELVAFVEGAAAIRIGIGALPAEYADLSSAARSVLYLRMLILWGTLRGGPFPLRPALEAVALHDGAQYAVREMFRRGEKHVGKYMFLLLISDDEATVERALEGLRKLTYRYFKKKKNNPHDYIANALDCVLGTGRRPADSLEQGRPSLEQEINVQAFQTGQQRWGALGPRGLTLRWLAGKLNIAHWAVADDLTDAARAVTRRLRNEELFNEEEILKIDIHETSKKGARARDVKKGIHDQAKLLLTRGQRQADGQDFVEKFLVQHPRHGRGIESLLSDEPLADIARQHGVTVQTVINWKNRALAALQKSARRSRDL